MKLKSIHNIKIKTKLIVLGAISIAGLMVMGVESVYTARQINQASTDISQAWLPSVIIAEELNTATSDYRLQENYHVIARDQASMDEAEAELVKMRREIDADFEKYENYITNEEDEQMMEDARNLWNRYLECSDELLAVSRSNRTGEAQVLIQEESQRLFDEASTLFLKVVDFNKRGAEAASIQGDKLYARLTGVKTVTIGLTGALIALLAIYIIRSIEKPVNDIMDSIRRVSNGDLDVRLDYRSEDEIGVLTHSMNALIERLNDIIKDEKHLLHEIGNENYHAQSECQQAYRGDFAPILYSITSLQSRLEQSSLNKKKRGQKREKNAVIERIDVRPKKDDRQDMKQDGKQGQKQEPEQETKKEATQEEKDNQNV